MLTVEKRCPKEDHMWVIVFLAVMTVWALWGMWKSAIGVCRDDIMVGFKIMCVFMSVMVTMMFVLLFWQLYAIGLGI